MFKSTSGDAEGALLGGKDAEGALLDGWDAEDALLDAGVFKSTSGDLLDAGVIGSANDEGVMGRNIDGKDPEGAPLSGGDTEGALLDGRDAEDALLDAGVFKSTRGDLLDAGVAGRSIGAGVGGG